MAVVALVVAGEGNEVKDQRPWEGSWIISQLIAKFSALLAKFLRKFPCTSLVDQKNNDNSSLAMLTST